MKTIHLALQGCGALDAFDCGVLQAFLKDQGLHIRAVTAGSLGILNALCVVEHALDRTKAQKKMMAMWQTLSQHHSSLFWKTPTLVQKQLSRFAVNHETLYNMNRFLQRVFASDSSQLTPLTPLKNFIETHFDLKAIQKSPMQLFISAMCVETNAHIYFDQKTLNIDQILACICHPEFNEPIKIEGKHYWGAHAILNPNIRPFIAPETNDVVIVWQMAETLNKLPESLREINDRIDVMQSMRYLQSQIMRFQLITNKKIHILNDPDCFHDLHWASKFNLRGEFIEKLQHNGESAGQRFLQSFEKNYETNDDLKPPFDQHEIIMIDQDKD